MSVLISLAIIFLALWIFVPKIIGTMASLIMHPLLHLETVLAHSGSVLPSYFTDRATLIAEKEALAKRLSYESASVGSIQRLQDENTRLRKLLGKDGESRIAAGVIGRPTATPYDTLVIDQGERDGVLVDTPVFIGIDQVIGFVSDVFEFTSVVTLVTTPGVDSTAYILGPDIYTTAHGLGGGVMRVSVPQGVPIAIGDVVIIPSFDAGVYGVISSVDSVPTEPEQHGYVTLDVPIQTIRYVSVGETPIIPMTFENARDVVLRIDKELTHIPVPQGVLVDLRSVGTGTSSSTDDVEVTVESE